MSVSERLFPSTSTNDEVEFLPPLYQNCLELEVFTTKQITPSSNTLPQSEQQLSPPPTVDVKVFSISLLNRFRYDRIRVCPTPEGVGPIISAVVTAWGGSLYSSKSSGEALEFQVWGNAWSESRSDPAAVYSRKMLTKILKNLACNGWNLMLGTELSKDEKGKDVMFFESGTPDPDTSIFCINFPRLDRIKVIDAPPEIINLMATCIKATWPKGIQEGSRSFYDSFEFKLLGAPWIAHSNQGIRKCWMISALLEKFRANGYKVYGSLKITKKEKEMQTLFFRKVTNVYK